MTQPRKRAVKKTTPRARAKEAVAEEEPREQPEEAVAAAPPPAEDAPVAVVPPPVAPTAQPAQHLAGLGPCRTCGAPGVVKADFPWTADKPVFCRKDTPPQYRFLLRA